MATKQLDITREHCPMTFVKTKIELAKLQSGDILEVFLNEEDIPELRMNKHYIELYLNKGTDGTGF